MDLPCVMLNSFQHLCLVRRVSCELQKSITWFVISSVAIAESRNPLLEVDKRSLHKVEMTKGRNFLLGLFCYMVCHFERSADMFCHFERSAHMVCHFERSDHMVCHFERSDSVVEKSFIGIDPEM